MAMVTKKSIALQILSDYKITSYSEEFAEVWDNFVQNASVNGTFLHTRKFYNHHPRNRIDDRSFLFYKRNKLIAVIGCTLQSVTDDLVLVSHQRSTYGGFVMSEDVGVEASIAIVHLFLQEAETIGVNQIIIRNPFRIFNKKPCDQFDYALWYFGFTILSRQLEIAIPLHNQFTIKSSYTEGTRSGLHKAAKALKVEESTDYETFWTLLEETLRVKHNLAPVHSYHEFLELIKNVGPGKIKLFVTKKEDRIIAGTIVFVVNETGIHSQYIAYDKAFQNERPLNILLHEVSRWAQGKGYLYFNLGTANEDNGKEINFNLFKFKESYGGRGVLRETLHLKL
jgi:hypothetical protein